MKRNNTTLTVGYLLLGLSGFLLGFMETKGHAAHSANKPRPKNPLRVWFEKNIKTHIEIDKQEKMYRSEQKQHINAMKNRTTHVDVYSRAKLFGDCFVLLNSYNELDIKQQIIVDNIKQNKNNLGVQLTEKPQSALKQEEAFLTKIHCKKNEIAKKIIEMKYEEYYEEKRKIKNIPYAERAPKQKLLVNYLNQMERGGYIKELRSTCFDLLHDALYELITVLKFDSYSMVSNTNPIIACKDEVVALQRIDEYQLRLFYSLLDQKRFTRKQEVDVHLSLLKQAINVQNDLIRTLTLEINLMQKLPEEIQRHLRKNDLISLENRRKDGVVYIDELQLEEKELKEGVAMARRKIAEGVQNEEKPEESKNLSHLHKSNNDLFEGQ